MTLAKTQSGQIGHSFTGDVEEVWEPLQSAKYTREHVLQWLVRNCIGKGPLSCTQHTVCSSHYCYCVHIVLIPQDLQSSPTAWIPNCPHFHCLLVLQLVVRHLFR